MLNEVTAQDLVRQAIEVRRRAYVPYSKFPVGAALLTASGKIYTGCNVENASYGLTVCAERVAIWKAVSEGETEFVALAVATNIGGSPCGACRQVMAEFVPDMPVLIADLSGQATATSVAELLPLAFTPQHLQQAASAAEVQ
jgi:cytidine deaminase